MLVHLVILSTAFAAANTGKHDIPLHRFPDPKTNPERYITWVSNIGGLHLQDKKYVYNNLRVCRKHFKAAYLYPNHQLCKLAIPELQLSAQERGREEEQSIRCNPISVDPAPVTRPLLHQTSTGGIEVPEFGEPITNLTVPIGRDATFECIVVNLGNFRVGWVKADTKAIQAIHEHVITHNPRVSVSHSDHSTWYLHIKNVQEEDRGQYMCQINTDPMKSQMGFLDVVIPPDFVPEETSGDTMVPEGGTARVSCKARGVPPPRVMWKREDGMEIVVRDQTGAKSKVLTYQGEVLKLTKISRSEMGTYLCIAGNGVPPTVSKRIHISVHFHPVIQVPNQLVGAPLGTDVTIECYVESSPKSINYWVKDPGELIIPSEHHVMSVRQKSMFEAEMTMTIKNIRREDLGSYICVAKNSLGDVESKIRLYEIPGNDRHAYQYPDVRATSDDEYGANAYDDDDEDVDSMKSNRVPDRANKWYSNDGKVAVTTATGASSTISTTTAIFLCLIKSLL